MRLANFLLLLAISIGTWGCASVTPDRSPVQMADKGSDPPASGLPDPDKPKASTVDRFWNNPLNTLLHNLTWTFSDPGYWIRPDAHPG